MKTATDYKELDSQFFITYFRPNNLGILSLFFAENTHILWLLASVGYQTPVPRFPGSVSNTKDHLHFLVLPPTISIWIRPGMKFGL